MQPLSTQFFEVHELHDKSKVVPTLISSYLYMEMSQEPDEIWFLQENIDLYSGVKLYVFGLVTYKSLI